MPITSNCFQGPLNNIYAFFFGNNRKLLLLQMITIHVIAQQQYRVGSIPINIDRISVKT